MASVVLSSLPLHSEGDVQPLFEELRSRISSICNKMLKAARKQKKKKPNSEAVWESQVIASACLRLQYALSIMSTVEATYDAKTLEKVVESTTYSSDEQNDESMLVLEVVSTLLLEFGS